MEKEKALADKEQESTVDLVLWVCPYKTLPDLTRDPVFKELFVLEAPDGRVLRK